jgi:NADPH-dependent curcumin reductase CurA
MVRIQNARVLFNSVPEGACGFASPSSKPHRHSGYPIPGETTVYDTTQTIDPETVPLNGGFLIETLALSIDPYLRGRMRHPETQSYIVS